VPDLALRLWLMDDFGRKLWWSDPPPILQAYQKIGIDEGCQAPRFLPARGRQNVPDEILSRPHRFIRPAPTR
jgi:hypothetical protein